MNATAYKSFFLFRRHSVVALVLLLGVTGSFALKEVVRHGEVERLEKDFTQRAIVRHALIYESLKGYEECVYNLRTLFENSEEVTPLEFAAATADLRSRHRQIQAIEWLPRVPYEKRAEFEAVARTRISPSFQITQRDASGRPVKATDRDVYFPILYLDHIEGNEAALGYDAYTGATRTDLDTAIRNRAPTLTRKIRLIQDEGGSPRYSIIIACPVFGGVNPLGAPVPSDALAGFVQIVLRLDDMLGESWQTYASNSVDTLVLDATPTSASDPFIYSRLAMPNAAHTQIMKPDDLAPSPHYEDTIKIGCRLWRVYFGAPPGWMNSQVSFIPLLILIGGLSFTAVLGTYLWTTLLRTHLIESQVAERTAELRHTQNLLENDIAKRETTEAELRESRRQLDSLLGQLPGMAYRLANDGRFPALYISHGCIDLTGHTSKELISRQIRYDDLVLAEDRENSWAAITGSLSDHQDYEVEYRLRHKNGEVKWVLDRGQGVYDQNGKLLFIEGLAIDVTKAKQDEIEKLIIERKLLEGQKLESLGVLAGGSAHDFNNLLTGIIGNASLVRLDIPEDSPLQKNLHQIESASLRAAELCQQMLAYAGKGQFIIQQINLDDIIHNTVPLLKHSISKRASLSFQLKRGLPSVKADATQIRQIIMNLVVNASDAIGDHDGVITLTTGRMKADDPQLRQAVLTPNDPSAELISLQVNDTGAGMSEDTIRKIFDPFFTTKFTGRGLGLAAVLGIIRGHGGGLIVDSKIGQGTTFTLLLPTSEVMVEHSSSNSPFDTPAARTGTVLIADDEEAVLTMTAQMLAMIGMKPLTAGDGVAAMKLFLQHQNEIRLVVLDLTMPRMNGEETLREIRTLSRTVPVILTSGYNRTTLTSPLATEPTVAFLQKPFTLSTLIDQIDLVLEKG